MKGRPIAATDMAGAARVRPRMAGARRGARGGRMLPPALEKKGKKRMKRVGSVEVPQEAFLAVLNLGDGPRK